LDTQTLNLRRALAECVLPYEALLMDAESKKWIAPEIWADIERAVIAARSAILETILKSRKNNAEEALEELWKKFPNERTIEVREDKHARYFADHPGNKLYSYSYGLVSIGENQFRGDTLEEAMQKAYEKED
jgi:ribosomal protein L16/L10AE